MFLHVLCKVRLLRIRLATELADVRLEMLRLLVLWNMFQETRLVHETLIA